MKRGTTIHAALRAKDGTPLVKDGLHWCPKCREYKDRRKFSAGKRSDGVRGYCKRCSANYEHKRANPWIS